MSIDHAYYGNPFAGIPAQVLDDSAEAWRVRGSITHRRIVSRPVAETPAVFLDEFDAAGNHVGYVGCAGDTRSAERMRAREAAERGIPQSQIRFSSPEAPHA